MASGFTTLRSFCFDLTSMAVRSNPSVASKLSTFSLSSSCQRPLRKHLVSASSNGLPVEFPEDSKFVPLNADDPRYGPPALLFLGFEVEEAVKIRNLLKGLDGEFLEIVFCTEDMINCSLWEAVNTRQPNLEAAKIAKSLPRICILSGLSGEEMMMFIDTFPEAGLEPAVFAALVPNSANKTLRELIDEIMGDHEMMIGTSKLGGWITRKNQVASFNFNRLAKFSYAQNEGFKNR